MTVVTDSAAALPADLVARLGIRVVPLWLVIGDERHRDGDIALDELVSRFSEPIATSAPSPGRVRHGHRRGPPTTARSWC